MYNKSKTSLFLIELLLAVLFFSLAGTVAVSLFVKSRTMEAESTELTYSTQWLTNAAEILEAASDTANGDTSNGDSASDILAAFAELYQANEHVDCNLTSEQLSIYFAKDWSPVSGADHAAYCLRIDARNLLRAQDSQNTQDSPRTLNPQSTPDSQSASDSQNTLLSQPDGHPMKFVLTTYRIDGNRQLMQIETALQK